MENVTASLPPAPPPNGRPLIVARIICARLLTTKQQHRHHRRFRITHWAMQSTKAGGSEGNFRLLLLTARKIPLKALLWYVWLGKLFAFDNRSSSMRRRSALMSLGLPCRRRRLQWGVCVCVRARGAAGIVRMSERERAEKALGNRAVRQRRTVNRIPKPATEQQFNQNTLVVVRFLVAIHKRTYTEKKQLSGPGTSRSVRAAERDGYMLKASFAETLGILLMWENVPLHTRLGDGG